MKKINWKIFNLSLWCEFIFIYFRPFETTDDFAYQTGFPLKCFSIYNVEPNINLNMSTNFLTTNFLINVFIIYFVIILFSKLNKKLIDITDGKYIKTDHLEKTEKNIEEINETTNETTNEKI